MKVGKVVLYKAQFLRWFATYRTLHAHVLVLFTVLIAL